MEPCELGPCYLIIGETSHCSQFVSLCVRASPGPGETLLMPFGNISCYLFFFFLFSGTLWDKNVSVLVSLLPGFGLCAAK